MDRIFGAVGKDFLPQEKLCLNNPGQKKLAIILVLFLAGILGPEPPALSHGLKGWKVPAKERKVKNPIPDNPESLSLGQKIYEDRYASCHGSRGDGQTEMGKSLNPLAPDFTDRHMMGEMTEGEIFWKITTGKGPMPSYKKELTEKERWDLVNYIKSLNHNHK